MLSSSSKVNVIHIDDEEDILYYSKTLLEEFEPRLKVTNVHSPTELFEELSSGKYDLVLSDYMMPDMNGIEIGEKVKSRFKIPFILYTGQGSEEVAARAFGVGIDDYLRKEREPSHFQVLAKRIIHNVERERKDSEIKKFENRLMALHEHSSQLGLSSSVQDVSNITLNILEQVMGLGFSSFQLVDDKNLKVIETRGHSPSRITSPLAGKGVTNRVARTGKSALIPDVRCDPDYYRVSSQSVSELCVPVLSNGVVSAILNVENEGLNAFSESDQQLMELLATHVATALSRLNALDGEKAQRKEYEHRLTALHAHSIKLNDSQTIREVSESTFKIMMETLGYPHASFHLLEDGVLNTQFISDEALIKMRLPIGGKGITTRAARTGQTVVVGDTRLDPDYVQGTCETLSELAVPAISQGKVYAVLNTESGSLNAFTEEDKKLIELLALHSAAALARLALKDKDLAEREHYEIKLIERSNQISSVLKAANKLNEAGSLEDVINITLDTLKTDFTFDWTGFGLVENRSIVYKKASDTSIPKNASIPLTRKTVTTRAVNTGETQLVKDVNLDPDYMDLSSNPGFRSELAVPILVEGEPKALINIEDKTVGRYTSEDQSLVELLAESVGSALKRLEQNKVVEALHQSAHYMSNVNSLEDLSKATFQTIRDVLGFDYGSFALVEGDNLVHRFHFGWNPKTTSLPLDGLGITVKAAVTGESQLVNSVRLDPDYYPLQDEDITMSELAVPVKVHNRVVAVINIESKTEHAFSEKDLALLEVLVHNISSAIELNGVHEQELTRKQRQIDSLLKNVERHGQSIRQNLRNPLQTITNAAYLMTKRPERSEIYYKVIVDIVSQCNKKLEGLWVNVKAADLVLQKVEINDLIGLSLKSVSGLERVSVDRVGVNPVTLIVDEARMKHTLQNLFQNAVDAMPEFGNLTVTTDTSPSGLVITIQDNGEGIKKQFMTEMFKPFFTTKSNGMGLGLSLCKQVVEAHGGSISLESKEGKGCKVYVNLPISSLDQSSLELTPSFNPTHARKNRI
jgi:putative methionine-R-sulfoxide reductase with GAF domain